MNSYINSDNLFQKLETVLRGLEKTKKNVVLAVFIIRLYNLIFSIAVLSLILGFLNVFPFDEFDFKTAVTIFKAFFYFMLALAVFKLAGDQLKNWYLLKNPAKLKIKKEMMIKRIILSVIIIVATWFIGTSFLGTEMFSKAFFMRFGGTAITLVILVFPILWLKGIETRFYKKFKSQVIPGTLKEMDQNAIYKADEFLSKESFTASKLVKMHNFHRFLGSDLIQGTVGDISFKMSYLNVFDKEVKKSSKGTETKISEVFNGILFESDFNKNFNSQTFIYPDVSRSMLGAAMGEMLNEVIHTKDKKLVKLEDPEFEKEFAIYSSDQIEARYILTPAFIERINELKSHFYDPFKISFIGNKIYIAILSNRNLFDPEIFTKLDSPKVFKYYLEIIGSMLRICEVLKLNVSIWK